MWQQLRKRFFRSSSPHLSDHPSLDPTVLTKAVSGADQNQRPYRTVGITEQRLREANRRSWLTSFKG
jgi:hypothetical protein